MLWFLQLAILRVQKWSMPWSTFWRRHYENIRSTALMVQFGDVNAPERFGHVNPWPYLARTTAFVTCALTVAGGSWYVAVSMTTASDLTAIYNCSAFFAYAFSVPLLGERLRWSKVLAVAVAIIGVLIVAYGDSHPPKHGSKSGGGTGGKTGHPEEDPDADVDNRPLGNLVIGVGSVLYGFYEVLYKRVACPPEATSPGRSMIFANLFGSCIGVFTLSVLWIPLPLLHWTGLETWEWPNQRATGMLLISTFSNAGEWQLVEPISLQSLTQDSLLRLVPGAHLADFTCALVGRRAADHLRRRRHRPTTAAAAAHGAVVRGHRGRRADHCRVPCAQHRDVPRDGRGTQAQGSRGCGQ